jgi:SAM-dependent methyltransferase
LVGVNTRSRNKDVFADWGLMPGRIYKGDPLTPEEREEFEENLIAFCDREFALLGDVRSLDVLYAGGSSLLWLEGLSQRIGEGGRLIALDLDAGRVEEACELLEAANLASPVRLVAGDVFEPLFEPQTFDLVYSAGLFHELDVREQSAEEALVALASVTRPGGRIATSDFVDSVPAVQLEDEELQHELAREVSGAEFYGIGSPERLIALHESLLNDLRWRSSPPYEIRHMDKVVLSEVERPEEHLSIEKAVRFRKRRKVLRDRIQREGYARPATLYVEGRVANAPG